MISAFRFVSSPPPFFVLRCRFIHVRPLTIVNFRQFSKLGSSLRVFSCPLQFIGHGGDSGSCCVHSLVDTVMEELAASRKRSRMRVCSAVKLKSSGELLDDKLANKQLQKGLLLEFKKDSDKILLAVAERPDGKKNWMVYDQNGVMSSIKPQQITYVIPGVENFDHAQILSFRQKAEDNLDPSLLEFAWVELLEKNKSVTPEDLAEMIFGSSEPLESYCAHRLLSKDEIYFTVLETKGPRSLYGPRPIAQVEELIQRKLGKAAAEKEMEEFVKLLESAISMQSNAKPPKHSWLAEEKTKKRIESLEAYAITIFKSDDQKKTAELILQAMGKPKLAPSALNLLIDIGYFPVHVNVDLLKSNIPTDHTDEVVMAAASLLSESVDTDQGSRKDLTNLKVYAIDVDEADELDDALSATMLHDGRIKVWIHIADPARYVQPRTIVDREAMRRGMSVFLPTATYPMFPEQLAMDGMSLRQGELCNAITVSVVLHSDGSIAEYTVDNSVIKPTYMLTYESASELLHLNLEEERELKILSEAAALRLRWRRQQGAVDTATLEARVKAANPEDPEPSISLFVENQADPAMRMVSEMMILCGEVIAMFGSHNNIPLPYRGQPQSNIDVSAFAHLPEGPVRSSAIVKIMRAAEVNFRNPIRHGILGLPGYVQFTSPIRRYMDLLAHYQVKTVIRGESPPFSAGQLEAIAADVNIQSRIVRKLSSSSLRYWIIEYLRRQPKERKYRALVLRFIKDRLAALLLVEVGFQSAAYVSNGIHVGDEVKLKVEVAHPRDDFVSFEEVP